MLDCFHVLQASLTECCILLELAPLELYRFLSGPLGVLGAFKSTLRLLSEHILDFIVPIVAQLVSQIALPGLSIDVLIDRCRSAVGEQGLVVQVVLLVVSKTVTESRRLIEQTLIIHHVPHCRLGLSKRNLF